MKEDNIFDRLENDFDCIADETIIADTGINTENVRKIVLEKINIKRKKRFSKKIIIGLIAAALSAAILTTGVVASGSFSATFAEWFSGDCNLGIYSGGNVYAASSNEDFDVNVLGVAGDDDEAYIAFEIKRNDGKSFDTSGITNIEFEDTDYNVSTPLPWQASGGNGNRDFYFKDDKTIQGNICYERMAAKIQGQRFTGKFNKMKILKYEDIKKCDYMKDTPEYDQEIAKLTEEYKDKLTENSYISSYYTKEDGFRYAVTDETSYDVCFDISLNLNYKSSTKECIIENSSAKSNLGEFTLSSARASAMSIRIVSNDHRLYNAFEGLDETVNGKVYMKNGDAYDIEYISSNQSAERNEEDGLKFSETTICAVYMKDGKRMAINPDDIEKLEMNGATFAVK